MSDKVGCTPCKYDGINTDTDQDICLHPEAPKDGYIQHSCWRNSTWAFKKDCPIGKPQPITGGR